MPHVQFVISNDSHHAAMMLPVAGLLAGEPGFRCSLLSLCEFRGLRTPAERFTERGVAVTQVLHRFPRPAGRQQTGASKRGARRLVRRLSWVLVLQPRLSRALRSRPDVVVLPNDSAFPYDGLASILRARAIPFVLVQEGIRFPLPVDAEEDRYGCGGAAAIAAWGEGSAEHFRSSGVPAGRIHLTGSPRFDGVDAVDWKAEGARLREALKLHERSLLLLSNPIDDQGFCSTRDKLDLLRRFAFEVVPVLEAAGLGLAIKLHGRESVSAVEAVLGDLVASGRIRVLAGVPLYPLFAVAAGAVVLASTVGLEGLLFDVPLGVLEIPGYGFVHDYVRRGAAAPLAWSEGMGEQVANWLARPNERIRAAAGYVRHHLAVRSSACDAVAGVIRRVVRS
jgi:hypothetical protein